MAFLHFAITLSCRPSAEPVAMARGPRATPAWGPCVRVRSRSQPSSVTVKSTRSLGCRRPGACRG